MSHTTHTGTKRVLVGRDRPIDQVLSIEDCEHVAVIARRKRVGEGFFGRSRSYAALARIAAIDSAGVEVDQGHATFAIDEHVYSEEGRCVEICAMLPDIAMCHATSPQVHQYCLSLLAIIVWQVEAR